MIKATAPEDIDSEVLSVTADKHKLVVSRLLPREGRILDKQPTAAGTWWKGKTAAQDKAVDEETAEAMDITPDASTDPPSGTPEAGQKRTHDASILKPAQRRKVDPTMPDFNIHECGGRGACGFNALAVGIAWSRGSGSLDDLIPQAVALGKTLRVEVRQHISKKPEETRKTWYVDPRWTTTTEGGLVPTTFEEWTEAIARPARWICQHTMMASAALLRCRIIVCECRDDAWLAPIIMGRGKHNIVLILHQQHYRLATPKSGNPADMPLNLSTPRDQEDFPRGAGRSLSSCSASQARRRQMLGIGSNASSDDSLSSSFVLRATSRRTAASHGKQALNVRSSKISVGSASPASKGRASHAKRCKMLLHSPGASQRQQRTAHTPSKAPPSQPGSIHARTAKSSRQVKGTPPPRAGCIEAPVDADTRLAGKQPSAGPKSHYLPKTSWTCPVCQVAIPVDGYNRGLKY